jgi:hypothetical protein
MYLGTHLIFTLRAWQVALSDDIGNPTLTFHFLPFVCNRRPCLKESSYLVLGNTKHSSSDPTAGLPPIIPADKLKQRRRIGYIFIDDREFPDKSDHYDNLLHNIEGGPILCKLKHLPPPLDEVHPKFYRAYDESKHGEQLKQDLDHLDPHVQEKIYALVKKYWSVFDKKGIFVLVKNYACVIDTGNALPIAIKKILYGPKETPIMWGCIAALERVGLI